MLLDLVSRGEVINMLVDLWISYKILWKAVLGNQFC